MPQRGTAGFAVNRRNNKEAEVPALLAAGFLFLPAAFFAWMLPDPPDETSGSMSLVEPETLALFIPVSITQR